MHASPCAVTHPSAGAPSFFARLFRSPYRLLFWTLLLVLGLLVSQLAFAATTYTVTDATDNAAGSLRYALNTATSGSDTIVFAPQVIGTITLTNGTLTVANSVTIAGSGANLAGAENVNQVVQMQVTVK